MNRFLLFAGDIYYPFGGWGDFVKGFDTLDEAKSQLQDKDFTSYYRWWHVVDLETMKVVKKGES